MGISGRRSGWRRIEITTLVIAGWTGRDKATVEHHIASLLPSA